MSHSRIETEGGEKVHDADYNDLADLAVSVIWYFYSRGVLVLTTQKLVDNCLTDAEFPELPEFYRGKVRDAYGLPGGRRLLISTDRQSAFDQVLASVPFKGQVLNQTAKFWFDETADICPNHVHSKT